MSHQERVSAKVVREIFDDAPSERARQYACYRCCLGVAPESLAILLEHMDTCEVCREEVALYVSAMQAGVYRNPTGWWDADLPGHMRYYLDEE